MNDYAIGLLSPHFEDCSGSESQDHTTVDNHSAVINLIVIGHSVNVFS